MGTGPKKVLFVTYSFPPDAEVGGKRTARFCRFLPEFGIEPLVLTIEERFYEALDRSYTAPPGLEVIRTGAVSNPLDIYRRWAIRRRARLPKSTPVKVTNAAARSANGTEAPSVSSLKSNLLLALQTPDRFWGWYWHAVARGTRLVRERNIQAIVSSAQPWTSHLVARAIRRKTGVPWIADFRDAWTLDPWWSLRSTWLDSCNKRLQAKVVHDADRVVCIADAMADDFRRRYSDAPPGKFLTITNGIEGEISPPEPLPPHEPRILFHLGSLYGDRRLENLFRAVIKLIKDGDVRPGSWKLLFVGLIDDQILLRARDEIAYLQQQGMLEIRDRIPFDEGQKALRSADILLLVQGDHPYAMPAKFYEYLVTGRPILVLAKGGTLARLVEEIGVGVSVDVDHVDDIAAGLMKALRLLALTPSVYERMIQRFNFRELSRQLANLIEELTTAADCGMERLPELTR